MSEEADNTEDLIDGFLDNDDDDSDIDGDDDVGDDGDGDDVDDDDEGDEDGGDGGSDPESDGDSDESDDDESDDEIKNLYDDLDEEDDEEGDGDGEGEDDEDDAEDELDGVSDEDIANTAVAVKEWADFIKAAEDHGETVSPAFLATLVRQEQDPAWMAERNIYSFAAMTSYAEGLEERVDPEAILIPKDEVARKAFEHEHLNVPEEPDDYVEAVFKDTFLDGEKERQDSIKSWAHGKRLSQEQLASVVDYIEQERNDYFDKSKEELREYSQKQRADIKTDYGRNAKYSRQVVKALLDKHGVDFMKEFGDSEALMSKSFHDMLFNIAEGGIGISADDIRRPPEQNKRDVTTYDDGRLAKLFNDLRFRPELNGDNAQSSKKSVRDRHHKAKNLYDKVATEMIHRGLL